MIVLGRYTTRWRNQYLDMFFGGKPIPPIPVYYFGLSLLPANVAGSVSEPPKATGYARVAYPNDRGAWDVPQIGYRSNTRPIVFPVPRAAWGLLKSVFLSDGVWALATADLVTPCSLVAGDDPVAFAPGAFLIGMT